MYYDVPLSVHSGILYRLQLTGLSLFLFFSKVEHLPVSNLRTFLSQENESNNYLHFTTGLAGIAGQTCKMLF